MTVLDEIADELRRQIDVEGFAVESDDGKYTGRGISFAAASYAIHDGDNRYMPGLWPWSKRSWKPTTRRHNLVKAAALIVAEIERLDRTAAKEKS